jgi:hypothetical protein
MDGSPLLVASLPAGVYRITYLSGCHSVWSGGGTRLSGEMYGGATLDTPYPIALPGDSTPIDDFEACEAAGRATEPVVFRWPGGDFLVWQQDPGGHGDNSYPYPDRMTTWLLEVGTAALPSPPPSPPPPLPPGPPFSDTYFIATVRIAMGDLRSRLLKPLLLYSAAV